MWATYKGRVEVALLLIDHGADVNAHGNYHISSLLWAAGRGHLQIVESLIQHGAKVNVGDKYGTTALVWASRKGYTEIVEVLLKAGKKICISSQTSSILLQRTLYSALNESPCFELISLNSSNFPPTEKLCYEICYGNRTEVRCTKRNINTLTK